MKIVVGNVICIVELTHAAIEISIDFLTEGHWVLVEHILKDIALQVLVDMTEIFRLQAVLLA